MKIQSDSTNFQSKIKFIDQKEFKQMTKNLNPKSHFVGYPWSPADTKTGKNMFTTGIMDCIAGGIIEDNKVRMFHIATVHQRQAKKYHIKGFDINEVERRILEGIDLAKDNIHSFIFGGFQMEENSKYNVNKLNKIKKIFEKNKIPYSIIGARHDVHYFGRYSLLYKNNEDTWYITSNLTGSRDLSGKGNEIDILENSIAYNVHKKVKTKYGFNYEQERKNTSTEDYFKSQFRDVSICKLDEFA